jgi:hypothetical protein
MNTRRYTPDDLASLKAKIRALRSRTTGRGCTEAEALEAAVKAAEMMGAAGLTEELIDRPPFGEVTLPLPAVRRKTPWLYLLTSISIACVVEMWTSQDGLVILGFEPDVLVAEYLVEMLCRCVETERAAFRGTVAYRRRRTDKTRRKATEAFVAGFIAALGDKVTRLALTQPLADRKAKRALVKSELDRREIEFRKRRSTKQPDLSRHEAFSHGQAAGGAVPIHSGVAAGTATGSLPAPMLALTAPGGRNV